MKLLNATQIINAIVKARSLYKNNKLSQDIANITDNAFWESTVVKPDDRKKQLIELAKAKTPKLTKKNPLYGNLNSYINTNSQTFDPFFTKQIKELAPHWFLSKIDLKKQQLLQLAKQNAPKPSRDIHKLGYEFYYYTHPRRSSYDPIFTKQIKELAPHWFVSKSTIANQKKQQLLKLAKEHTPRPTSKIDSLAIVLKEYTNPNKNSYDPIFTKQIKELAPHWFVPRSTIADQKKQQLLKLAKTKKPRPSQYKSNLGTCLNNYTYPKSSCYDPIFTKKIKSIAPQWFIHQSEIAKKKKQKLLQMAKNNQPRPKQKQYLGISLKNYVCIHLGCYDPIFTKQIKELAPHWFKK